MGNVTNLTQSQVEKIQIDEGVIYLNYGESDQRLLAPTRGGGEFSVTNTIRDIEFDGRIGKTAGAQVVEDQTAVLKVVSLCMSQDELALAIPNCSVSGAGDAAVITNGEAGLIPPTSYIKNVTMFAKLIGGKFKKITIYRALHEGALTAKAAQKAEGELSLEFTAHYNLEDFNDPLYEIEEVTTYRAPLFVSAATSADGLKVLVTFNTAISATGLVAEDFTVEESDIAVTISSIGLNGSNAKIVELTLSSELSDGTTITVAYTKGTAKSADGVPLESFAAQYAENNVV